MKDTFRFNRDLGWLLLLIALLTVSTMAIGAFATHAQNPPPSQTPATQSPAPVRSATPAPSPTPTPVNWSEDPMLKRFVFRGIGPASMGGRVDDIAAVEGNPYIFYVGLATGGVWKTTNNGTTFTPVFDSYSTASIGDIAIAPSNPDIVWVGTGEANNRQSASFGDGIYKSTDGGKTFTRMGLENTQTIARIVIDPKDPNVVYVAVLGHLFGPNLERGILKTTDAGKNWKRLDGNGLPEGLLGRIGIDVSRSNPNVLYAQIEVGASTGTGGEEVLVGGGQGAGGGGATASPTPTPTPAPAAATTPSASPTPAQPDPKKSGVWRSDDKGRTWRVVASCFNAGNCTENNRPMYYSQIRVDPSNAENVFVGGLNFSKSIDGGKKFISLQPGIAHSDHHAIWVDPKNGNHIMIGNDGGLDVTYDQGATWEFVNTIPAAQFYAVAADMRKPYYVYGGLQDNGSWGGPSQTRNPAGITNADWFRIGGGDGFYAQADPSDPFILYSESQNGAMSRIDLRTGRSQSIRPRTAVRRGGGGNRGGGGGVGGRAGGGGDAPTASAGAQDPQAVLAAVIAAGGGGGFGGFGGANLATSNVVPAPAENEQYRFYWNTPLVMSPHNPRLLYAGGNRLFKSLDRGDTWTATTDLTKHIDRNTLSIMGVKGSEPMASKNDGYTSYGYVVTVAESSLVPGILWAGTDDGNVQLSRDGGATWTNVG